MSNPSKRPKIDRARDAAPASPVDKPSPRRAVAVRPPAHVRTQDAHGFDPDDFDWLPVPRRKRADGWTPDKQRDFIEHLADTGSVRMTCERLQITPQSAYRLRRSPEGAGFAAAWDAAMHHSALGLLDDAMDRARHGWEEPVWRDGEIVGHRRRYSDTMAMFLLRKQIPDRFGDLHRDRPAPSISASAPPPLPVAQTLERLGPVQPADPVAAIDPDLLDLSLLRLKRGAMPPGLENWTAPNERLPHEGIRPEHEAMLEQIKRDNAGRGWTPRTYDEGGGDEGDGDDDYKLL